MKKDFLILDAVSLIILLLNIALIIVFNGVNETAWGIAMPLLSLFLFAGLFVVALLLKNARDCANISLVLHIGIALRLFDDYIFNTYVQSYTIEGSLAELVKYFGGYDSEGTPVFIVLSSVISALALIICCVFMYFYVTDLNHEKPTGVTSIAQNRASVASNVNRQAAGQSSKSAYEELIKLKQLYDDGIISQEIYDIKKSKYLEML